MAPSFRPGKGRPPRGDEDGAEARADRRVSGGGGGGGGGGETGREGGWAAG